MRQQVDLREAVNAVPGRHSSKEKASYGNPEGTQNVLLNGVLGSQVLKACTVFPDKFHSFAEEWFGRESQFSCQRKPQFRTTRRTSSYIVAPP